MPAQQIRLMVVEDVPQVASHIRSLLQSQTQIKMLEVVTSGDQALSSVAEVKPDVVIVDALLQGRVRGADVAQQIRQAEPQVGLIMLTVPQNPVAEDPDRGVDAVLKMPFSGFDLTTLVRTVGEARAQETAGSGCLMISMFSPKGGVGRTTLAYNIAVALGQQHRVCVVDGSMQFSDMRGLISVPPSAPRCWTSRRIAFASRTSPTWCGATRRGSTCSSPRRGSRWRRWSRRRTSRRRCRSSASSTTS